MVGKEGILSRKMLPREWALVLSLLGSIAGMALSPETAETIIKNLSEYLGQGLTLSGLLSALTATVRIIYKGKKEGASEASNAIETQEKE